jgi:tetratricopeptide (TPR) repeat protein
MSEPIAMPSDSASRAGRRPFVGRARELDELRAALDQTAEGRGSLVLLSGEAGIGKTRLLQELVREARDRGLRVATGRCWEGGGAPAYWPWIQAVRALGGDAEGLAAGAGESVDPETARFRLFDSVAEFLVETAAGRPLLVVLDDIHAADTASLVMLRFVSESAAGAPVVLVGSYREREAQLHERPESFAELVREATRIPLRGLNVDEVEAYLAGVAGGGPDRALAERLHTFTGGNPFFLGEVVRLVGPDGLRDGDTRIPEEVRTLLRRRMADLSPDAVETLRLAAVVGRDFNLRVLERTGRLEVARLLEVLDEAGDAGVITENPAVPRQYGFVHELIRETLYEDLSPAERLDLHGRIGAVLEDLYRNDLDPHLSEIAHHLSLAAPLGDVSAAIDYLVRAGDRSAALLAYEEASGHYERALGLLGSGGQVPLERRSDMLLRLGDARWRAGDSRAARTSFEEAADLARRLGDGERLARAALGYVVGLGGSLLFARFEVGASALGLLEDALAALPEEDSPLRAQVLARLAVEIPPSTEDERRLRLSTEAIQMSRRLDDPEALAIALHARHWALGAPELVGDRIANSEEILALAADLGDQELAFLARNARVSCFLELCDGPGFDAEIVAMAQLAERIRQPFYRWHVVCLRVIRAELDGRFEDAERLAREALQIARLRRSEYAAYVYEHAQLVSIRWAQGRLAEYWPEVADHSEAWSWVPRWRDALAAAERGDHGAAAVEVARHAGRFEEIPRDLFWPLRLCSLAEAAITADDAEAAGRLYELLRPFDDRNTIALTQVPLGPVALRLGRLAAMLGRWDEADDHFETALRQCDLLGARSFRARVLEEHGRTLEAGARAGDRERAVKVLDEARRLRADFGLEAALPEQPDARFVRDGELWTIAYDGTTTQLRDTKGLRHIATLLAAPGAEVHVLELVAVAEGSANGAAPAGEDLRRGRPSDLGPLIDPHAREEYRRRLEDLREELEEARGFADEERAARVEEEIDALVTELARATGLGGRDRPQGSPSERARVNVTKAIRTAIKLIERQSPALGEHLTASIQTGRFCSYAPPGEAPPRWVT